MQPISRLNKLPGWNSNSHSEATGCFQSISFPSIQRKNTFTSLQHSRTLVATCFPQKRTNIDWSKPRSTPGCSRLQITANATCRMNFRNGEQDGPHVTSHCIWIVNTVKLHYGTWETKQCGLAQCPKDNIPWWHIVLGTGAKRPQTNHPPP